MDNDRLVTESDILVDLPYMNIIESKLRLGEDGIHCYRLMVVSETCSFVEGLRALFNILTIEYNIYYYGFYV